MAMAFIKNDNDDSPPQLGPDVVKVVVIGEPQVGKTKFIHAYYNYHDPGEIYSCNGARVYPCEFEFDGTHKRAAIFEIPGDPASLKEQRMSHYEDAKVIVLMYAVDNPSSFKLLTEKWLPEAGDMIQQKEIPVILVGNKMDLRENDDIVVIERLLLDDNDEVIESPHLDDKDLVTEEQGEDLLIDEGFYIFSEISATRRWNVFKTFKLVFEYAVKEWESD